MFRKIIDFCVKNGFLKLTENSLPNEIQIEVGLPGALLEENLKREWFDNFLNSKEIPVFYNKGDFKDTYIQAKKLMMNVMPFGIIELKSFVNKSRNKENSLLIGTDSSELSSSFSDYFMNDSRLLYTIFLPPTTANQSFHQIQRQRKIWWRKISASPGRYTLGDIQNGETTLDASYSSVNIYAKYPWGNQLLESIKSYSNRYPGLSHADSLIRDGRKEVPAVYIQCETSLSNLFLNSLCDAYEEPVFQGEKRPLLRFHRKIAPFKISFSLPSSSNTELFKELQGLALYLTKLLRNNYITTLLLPSNARKTLDAQYKQYDELGIPFNVHLNEATLKDGIAWLRSRDTTLKEQVHVAELVRYIEKIYKNF
ncbi:DNA polymerase subunit gamma-2, mitochondrial [Coccinella septempunctata]|uniref:DNA polymerase subunit gamma-2, mitochondrial n=1 Tax=Coccinella septempunctata TaxID=41139 RepID=UPI001D0614EA|nr:DNA polymerase subunit gamma-2, mitochondrial [Coccinella septempunctata]